MKKGKSHIINDFTGQLTSLKMKFNIIRNYDV